MRDGAAWERERERARRRWPSRAELRRGGALRGRRDSALIRGRRIFRAEAMKTQQEKKQTEVAVEESFPFRETAPPDEPLVTAEESWVVKLEQSVNIFLTESVITILDGLYRDRNYAIFFVLETIARVPYFGEDLVLHARYSLQELGGNSLWVDRFLAWFAAFFYYFMTVAMYTVSPRMAYRFSECVERHAYSTYDKFIKLHEVSPNTKMPQGCLARELIEKVEVEVKRQDCALPQFVPWKKNNSTFPARHTNECYPRTKSWLFLYFRGMRHTNECYPRTKSWRFLYF
uniref:Ubiquinol oxidase n=1 Tax=Oryza meridionalis TaxID=40149 RepID=A0A0E0DAU7_9ORYZ